MTNLIKIIEKLSPFSARTPKPGSPINLHLKIKMSIKKLLFNQKELLPSLIIFH